MHALRSAAALQTAALRQSATISTPATLKNSPGLRSPASKQPRCAAALQHSSQHSGKPEILQHSKPAAQQPSDFQLLRSCSIAAMYSCLAAVLPFSSHRMRQRSMFGLPKTALPIYWRGRPSPHYNFTDLGRAVRNCVLSLRVDGKGSSVRCVLNVGFLNALNVIHTWKK